MSEYRDPITGQPVGALTIAIVLSHVPIERHIGRKTFAVVALYGIATTVFGLSTWFPLSLAALVMLGASDAVSVVIRFTLVQIETPDEKRGRVSAINYSWSARRIRSANSNPAWSPAGSARYRRC